MKPITKEMIKIYNLKKLGYDFMGYKIYKPEDLSFHHLVVPKRDCKEHGLGEGYLLWNGAILNQDTSHDYLHIIERTDRELFLRITLEMIEENSKGKLDIQNLRNIRNYLLYFEDHYKDLSNNSGKKLIKKKYIEDRIIL